MFKASSTFLQRCSAAQGLQSFDRNGFTSPLTLRSRPGKRSNGIRIGVHQPYGVRSRAEAARGSEASLEVKVVKRILPGSVLIENYTVVSDSSVLIGFGVVGWTGWSTEGSVSVVQEEREAQNVVREVPKLSILSNKRLVRALACVALVLAARLALPAAVFAAEQVAGASGLLAPFKGIVDFILHLDDKLGAIITEHGRATYAILFAIVFCETGLVLTPFLPGDSLLFAAGAFAGLKKLNIYYLLATFISSAILGDAVNYSIGSWLGEKAIDKGIVSKKAVTKTEKFYEKYGGKTIVLARFVPIVRTFAPFVAGISKMAYQKFATYNVVGAVVWTLLFTGVGFFFGNLPFVEKNFSLVVLAIVAISVLPVIFEVIAARREEAESGDEGSPAAA